MVSKSSWETHTNIRDFISNKAEHLGFEVFLKEFFLVHCLTTHPNKVLTFFECLRLEELFLYNRNNWLLFKWIFIELFKDIN